MLSKADTPPSQVIPRFTAHGIEAAFLVPTPTGLDKSILDAVGPLRDFLKRRRYHDFEIQAQADKVLGKAYFVYPDRIEETTVSLYRPQTKHGDPRIWFYGLGKYAKAFNLLAILCEQEKLYVVNASVGAILDSLDHPASPLGHLARKHDELDPAASELLHKLKQVGQRGYLESLRRGDTGIGYTLESLLGIRANTARTPDFKGIEIKASRKLGGVGKQNRVTLFSQVPTWDRSQLRSGLEVLNEYGYERAGRLQLYCTVAAKANPQGLYFDISEADLLWNRAKAAGRAKDVVCWETAQLTRRLLEKHPATMWVKARCRGDRRTCEEFHYVEAVYTRNPVVTTLVPLIDAGIVTMDYTLSMRDSGAVRDHGYLFKIHPDDLPALFPPPKRFDLTS